MSMTTEFINFLLQLAFWYFIYTLVANFVANVRKRNNAVNETIAKDFKHKIHVVYQEKINDMYYWYDNETKEFLVQGANTEEISNKIKKYFMGHVFIADNYTFSAPDYTPKPLGKVITIVG